MVIGIHQSLGESPSRACARAKQHHPDYVVLALTDVYGMLAYTAWGDDAQLIISMGLGEMVGWGDDRHAEIEYKGYDDKIRSLVSAGHRVMTLDGYTFWWEAKTEQAAAPDAARGEG